tara:strand:+ start:137 stop:478 length:342 start_codon:yes stop_codon:yes gene_type:complete
MNFNPEEPYGRVFGNVSDPQLDGARFIQGVYFYNAHRKCLNPNVQPKPETDDVTRANDNYNKKLADAADKAMVALQNAKDRLDLEGSTASKTAHTKAKNAYQRAQDKLEAAVG